MSMIQSHLAPGEKVGFKWDGDELKYFIQEDYQEEVYQSIFKANSLEGTRNRLNPAILEKITITIQST